MLFMTTYHIIGDRSPERTAAMMEVFGERGEAEGTVAHYVRADGGGGFIVQDISDATKAYADSFAYAQWLHVETTPLVTIEEAVPIILEGLADAG